MGAILNNRIVKWFLAYVIVFCGTGWALWAYYQHEYPTCTFRYKLTAEVQTPDGVKTGSSVLEVSYSHNGDWGGGPHPALTLTGQATYIDLGSGKNLFLLLTNRDSGRNSQMDNRDGNFEHAGGALTAFSLPIKIFGLEWFYGQEPKLCSDLAIASASGPIVVPIGNLPTLVTFSDINDYTSVKVVQPSELETDIGMGYKLLDARIEAANEPVSHNIEQILTWWTTIKVKWIHRGFAINDPLIFKLGYTAFRGFQKSDDRDK